VTDNWRRNQQQQSTINKKPNANNILFVFTKKVSNCMLQIPNNCL